MGRRIAGLVGLALLVGLLVLFRFQNAAYRVDIGLNLGVVALHLGHPVALGDAILVSAGVGVLVGALAVLVLGARRRRPPGMPGGLH